MFRAFRERDGALHFRPAAGYPALGCLMVAMGAGLAVAFVVGHERVLWKLERDPSVALALLLPVAFLWFGRAILRGSRWRIVDPRARRLRIGDRDVALDDVSAVLVSTTTKQVKHGEYQTWELGLVSGGVAPATRDALRGRAATELPDANREDLHAYRIDLIDNASADEVWRAAKKLSRALDLPLVDDAGATTILVPAALVGRPLVERLAPYAEPDEPAPPGLHVEESGGRLILEWDHRRWAPLLVLGAVILGFLGGAAALLANGAGWAALPLALPGLVLLPILSLAGHGHGRNAIEIDADAIRVTQPFPRRRTTALPLADLEALRANRVRHPSLDFVCRSRVLRCPMPADLVVPARALVLRRLAR